MADEEKERLAKDGLAIMIREQGRMMDKMLKNQDIQSKRQKRHDMVILIAVMIFAVVVIAGLYALWRLDENNVFMQILWALEGCRDAGVIG